MSSSLAERWMKDFRKSSDDVGLALNSLIRRDRSEEYCRRGPDPKGTGSRYPKLGTRPCGPNEPSIEPGAFGTWPPATPRASPAPCAPADPAGPYAPVLSETGGNIESGAWTYADPG